MIDSCGALDEMTTNDRAVMELAQAADDEITQLRGVQFRGLTKREWFAGMALQGLMANKDKPQFFVPKDDANYCLAIADALLTALDQTHDK